MLKYLGLTLYVMIEFTAHSSLIVVVGGKLYHTAAQLPGEGTITFRIRGFMALNQFRCSDESKLPAPAEN